MARKPHPSRNKLLARGISRFSRSAMARKTGVYLVKNRKPVEKKKEEVKPKTKTFGKGTREIKPKTPRWYPTEDLPRPLPSRKNHHRPARLRKSITPGTVLILLASKFRGRRVVFLKQLPSGLLLITGPYKVNGVPLRRVSPAYVIATSTKIDISGVKIDPKFNDDYFKRPVEKKNKKTEAEFFEDKEKEEKKKKIEAARIEDQKAFDKPIIEAIKKQPNLTEYLKAHFTLSKGDFPHRMKF